jgi:branched-chain amino acid transport system substrate-binding protein
MLTRLIAPAVTHTRRLRTALALLGLASLLGAAPPASAPPVVVNAVIPLTGGGAFLGASFASAFRAAEILVNETGGIHGRPLKIVAADSQTQAVVGLQIVQGFVAQHAALFLDGGPAPVCNASLPLVAKNGPVDYCLSPAFQSPAFSYGFSTNPSTADVTAVVVRYFRLRGWTRIAMISATDASSQVQENQTIAAIAQPENRGVTLVAKQSFAPSDVSVSAQISAIQAAKPQAIVVWATGTPVATVLRALSDGGNTLPVQISGSNMIYQQLHSFAAFLPKQLFFSTPSAMTPNDTPAGPVRDAQKAYINAMKRVGARADIATNLAWDPILIFVNALRHFGPDATAEQVHDYIIHLHGWVGINGVYDFSSGDQRGIGQNGLEMAQWDAQKTDFARASAARGFLLAGR